MNEPATEKIRRKVLLNILTSPTTAAPFLAGITALVATWAFGMRADIGVLAGLAGILVAAGAFFTKFVFRGEAYAKQAVEETRQEEGAERERVLDGLDARLCQDADPRTEAVLRDLRSLVRAFDELCTSSGAKLNELTTANIASGVHELFSQCVSSLERSLKLWQTAAKLRTKAAREPILKQREDIILDVGKSIRQLGQTLVAIQNLGTGGGTTSELARIGEELDQHLAVARQVEQRVRAFESQLDERVRE
jgi:hypothetical protein